ncbi:putative acetyltransferase [Devosia lucknowensis]|uniref:Putative acetyltransferase n=1 Tax=Devosia lucknowensis TaxID=1096929 RepID=A0A1Y6ERJ8_9HYPH|nr:GNAT family N-acetyltransferase [Devosia lucknowensis]SMQ64899.1 putative acetyltransferase [Devosia lucknowensis]
MSIAIVVETPLQDDVRGLVSRLNDHLLPLSPVEFQFKMTVEQMADSDTTLFVARNETGRAVGMGALKMHGPQLGEVKRMYTVPEVRGQRVGRQLLDRIVDLARQRNVPVIMLETGTGEGMAEAHRLYSRYGFVTRGPFLDYPDSEWSAFFEMRLDAEKAA